jgi:hypothetical protein
MKILSSILLFLAVLSPVCLIAKDKDANDKYVPLFKENKGQLVDQNSKLRADVLYYGSSDGLSYFFKNTGISYQLYQNGKGNEIHISRLDITWLGANTQAKIVTQNTAVTIDNFYNTTQKEGVVGVRNFGDLQYQGIYQGIDLHYYYKNGSLKYDFIVAPQADYKKIQIKVEGATALKQNVDGTISISTPNGILTEGMPVAYQGDKEVKTNWVLKEGILSFQLSDYDTSLPVVIDPLVYQWSWQTNNPYGLSTVATYQFNNTFDTYGNIYTTYFHKGAISSQTGLAKYNNTGNGTGYGYIDFFGFYVGPTGSICGIAVSGSNVYVGGSTDIASPNIATTGAYQTTIVGNMDAFLIKYDSIGTKLWATYYGGGGNDSIRSCKADANGNVYVCGMTRSTNNIASTGAYQSTLGGMSDAFIAKFTTSGSRVWSTYLGGSNNDNAGSIDVNGNRVFVAGTTKSSSGIAIGTVYQSTFSGSINGFLTCLDTSGAPQWSTYYGTDSTMAENCVANNNYVYLCGSTNATTTIATSGTYQPANAGNYDGFLVKFNVNGVRQWGTYYGGLANESALGCSIGGSGNLYICGTTKSNTGISAANAYNLYYDPPLVNGAGYGSAYLAELDTTGQRISATYCNLGVGASHCSSDNNGNIVLTGWIYGPMASVNSFMIKFNYCNSPTPVITAPATNFCANATLQLSTASVPGFSYQWYRNDALLTGATNNTFNATLAGNYKVVLNQCSSGVSAVVTLTSTPPPSTQITHANAPCSNATNGSITVTTSGGTPPYTYAWDNSTNTSATLSGLIPGSYVVHTTDANTCIKTDTVTILNTHNSPSSITSNTNIPCYGAPVASITLTTSGGTAPYRYAWDNLPDTTSFISGLDTGTFVVHTSDSNNCMDVDTVIVGQDTVMMPSNPLASICAVTVDSVTGKNLITWAKTGIVKAIAYNIYREGTVAGQYDLIGTVSVNDNSVFIDTASIPLQQSYSYKIAEVDSCNHEWPMSDLHKTIHLNANVGINGEINLIWNAYEGRPYTTHRIMRSFNSAPFALLNEVSSTITTYSDLTPPIGNNVYRIEIDLGTACDSSNPNTQWIRSNKMSLGDNNTAVNNISKTGDIQIVPNPTTGVINILGNTPGQIRLYDAIGRVLLDEKNTNKLDIGKFSKGVYMIRLFDKSGNLYHSQKVILK